MRVPHTNYAVDSSVAATMGSRPSSVMSESMVNSFSIYPLDESGTDRLVTKVLVLGDFESAVSLYLSSDRFSDAILLAVRGGPELLQRTQRAYFERRTMSLPYLHLFQSIVSNDLLDIVQNADLQKWQEIFFVLCTFASDDEFAGLPEQLGRRLEFEFTIASASEDGRGEGKRTRLQTKCDIDVPGCCTAGAACEHMDRRSCKRRRNYCLQKNIRRCHVIRPMLCELKLCALNV